MVVIALDEEVLRIICVYGPQSGRTPPEKEHFYDDLRIGRASIRLLPPLATGTHSLLIPDPVTPPPIPLAQRMGVCR